MMAFCTIVEPPLINETQWESLKVLIRHYLSPDLFLITVQERLLGKP